MNNRHLYILIFICLCIFGLAQIGWPATAALGNSTPPRSPIPNSAIEKATGIYHLPLGKGVNLVYVDLSLTLYTPLVTPLSNGQLPAMTVADFASTYDCALAINGPMFGPYDSTLSKPYLEWDRYHQPLSGSPLWSAGPAITRGTLYPETAYKPGTKDSTILSFTRTNQASITSPAIIPFDAFTAISGHKLLLNDGQATELDDTNLEPRTAVGLDQSGTILIILTVDGRQELLGYRGSTFYQLSQTLLRAGAYTAMSFDGGGSTTLVLNNKVANSPAKLSNGFIPQLRPVGPSLGFCP